MPRSDEEEHAAAQEAVARFAEVAVLGGHQRDKLGEALLVCGLALLTKEIGADAAVMTVLAASRGALRENAHGCN